MKRKDKIILGLILGLAVVLRTLKLNDFPYGFHFDEAKAAWNALSIAKTGMDDQGNKLPMYYNSFGDYRPTGIFYTIIPFLMVLGRSITVVRLPAALFGAFSIIAIYFLAKELSPGKSKTNLGLWSAFFLAINPWHISVSRATSEVVISIFLTIWGLYFLIRTIKTNRWKYSVFSVLFLLLSFWFYHSIRVLAPVLILIAVTYYFFRDKKINKWVVMALLVIGIISGVLMLSPEARGRLSQVSIRSDFKILYETQKAPNEEGHNSVLVARAFHNKVLITARRFVEEYFSYFGTDFLVGRTAKPMRYMTTNFGLITYIEFGLLLLGIAAAVVKKDIRLVFLWLLVAPIPAAVTLEDVPNLHRSMLMVPFIVMIETWGFSLIWDSRKRLGTMILLLLGINFVYYLHFYYNHGNYALAIYSRNSGIVEMVNEIEKQKDSYDKVVLTNYSDNPYAWYAFFENKEPDEFNQNYKKLDSGAHEYGNLVFSNERCPTNLANDSKTRKDYKNVLFVNGEGCEINSNLLKETKIKQVGVVERLDESDAYTMWTGI